jgi:type VI secretion system lysozyme-like protein
MALVNVNRYKEPKSFLGSRPLLFDRLIDLEMMNPFESADSHYLTKDQVKQSIQLEISRLLNTRRAEGLPKNEDDVFSDSEEGFGTPFYFGLPDFQSYDASNVQDWDLIANLLKNAINYFEPRIKNITVEVINFNNNSQLLEVNITGSLNLQKTKGEVTFPVVIDCTPQR